MNNPNASEAGLPATTRLGEIRQFVERMLPHEGPGVVLIRPPQLFYMNHAAIQRCPDTGLRQSLTTALEDTAHNPAEIVLCFLQGDQYEIQRLPPGPPEPCTVTLELLTDELE
jgi:hypothetical protein